MEVSGAVSTERFKAIAIPWKNPYQKLPILGRIGMKLAIIIYTRARIMHILDVHNATRRK